jgi:hypothetical protein
MHGCLARRQRIPAARLGRGISRGDVVVLPIHGWGTLDIRCGDVAYVGKGRVGSTRFGPNSSSLETSPRARRKSRFSVVHRSCSGHYLDYRSHVCALQSSPIGALCDGDAERVPQVVEWGPTGAVFRFDRCGLPFLAVRLSSGFGSRVVVPTRSDRSASLARAHGYDLDDSSFASWVNSCRKASDLFHNRRNVRASHGKGIAQTTSRRLATQRGGRVLWRRC